MNTLLTTHPPPPPCYQRTTQSLLMSFVGVLTAVVLVNASVVLKAVYHDTNPTSKSIQARSHSRVAVGKMSLTPVLVAV